MDRNIQTFRDLEAWQLAMDTVDLVSRVSAGFPQHERFGLVSQVRRAAVSIPSNIAEGHARRSLRSYLNPLGIALGSLGELDTELEIAERLRYCTATQAGEVRERLCRTRQTVHGLRRSLEVRLFASFGSMTVLFLLLARVLTWRDRGSRMPDRGARCFSHAIY